MPRPATITGPYTAALDLLRADLARHQQYVTDTEALIVGLERRAANGAAPPQPRPPVKNAGGRPPIDPNDADRARRAEAMRNRRQRLRAAAAAPAAKKPPKPKAARSKKTAPPSAAKASEPATDAPPAMSADDIRTKLAEVHTLPEIAALAGAADKLVAEADAAKDVDGFRAAHELRLRCGRAGAQLLVRRQSGRRAPPLSRLGISDCAGRWRELAALDDGHFQERIDALSRRWPKGVPHRSNPPPSGPVEVSISEWVTDETGCMSRVLTTGGTTPVLKGEHPPAT